MFNPAAAQPLANDPSKPQTMSDSSSSDGAPEEKKEIEVKKPDIDIKAEIKAYALKVEINAFADGEKFLEKLALEKAAIPIPKLFYLGILAGWWVALSVLLCVTMSGGIPLTVRQTWPMLPKIVTGFLYPISTHFIILFGGELFTANSMVMLVGLYSRRITILQVLTNWLVVLVGNFVGAVFIVYIFGDLTKHFYDDPWKTYLKDLALYKVNMAAGICFLRAIAANSLVCTSLLIGWSARDMTGKLCALWFPTMNWAAVGFEHIVQNFAYMPLAFMYGADAYVDYSKWFYQNLLLTIAGNAVGGGMIIGLTMFILFDWSKLPKPAPAAAPAVAPAPANGALLQVIRSREESKARPALPAPPSLDDNAVRRAFAETDVSGRGALEISEAVAGLSKLGFQQMSLVEGVVKMHAAPAAGGRVTGAGFLDAARCMHKLRSNGLCTAV